ncbi:MAG: disulfide oxidoreductase, partial [Pseudomonadota bacterium]
DDAAGDTAEPVAADTSEPATTDDAAAGAPADPEGPEVEVFYTFTWGGNRGARSPQNQRRQGAEKKPRGTKGKPQGKGKGKPRDAGPKKFSSAPPKKEKQIDPNNPFAAALMGLKDKT